MEEIQNNQVSDGHKLAKSGNSRDMEIEQKVHWVFVSGFSRAVEIEIL